MIKILLTLMLLILPFLISQKEVSRPGLHTGLWVSLFFWGQIHPMFSILTFFVALCYYMVLSRQYAVPAQPFVLRSSGSGPLAGFLEIMVIFCAFGNVCKDFGSIHQLSSQMQNAALVLGFVGSLAGPILFGMLSDKTGPFRGCIAFLGVGLTGLVFTAISPDFPPALPLGTLLIQSVIGGFFTLMPLMLLRFFGRPQLPHVLPLLLLILIILWSAALRFYHGADAPPQDYLLSMVFLILIAAVLCRKAWRSRLTVL